MFDDNQERSERLLFGLPYMATLEEHRELTLALSRTTESVVWGKFHHLEQLVTFDSNCPAAIELATAIEAAETRLQGKAGMLIRDLIADRGD